MKTAKKTIAVLLCFLMLSFSFSVISFAEEPLHYVVLGDSIAKGTGLMNEDEACYGRIVADTCGYSYANYGVDGHTTDDLLGRLSEENVRNDVIKADIISISIGGNDYRHSGLVGLLFDALVKKDYSKADRIAEKYYNNLCRIMGIINELNDDAVILMQTMYNPQMGTIRPAYQQAADRINAAIARYDAEYPDDIVIVDVGTTLGSDEKNYAGDAMHPSAEGNEKIARLIVDTLYSMNLTDKTELQINTKGKTNVLYPARAVEILGVIFTALGKIYDIFDKVGNMF